jgi:hypothetical protein
VDCSGTNEELTIENAELVGLETAYANRSKTTCQLCPRQLLVLEVGATSACTYDLVFATADGVNHVIDSADDHLQFTAACYYCQYGLHSHLPKVATHKVVPGIAVEEFALAVGRHDKIADLPRVHR